MKTYTTKITAVCYDGTESSIEKILSLINKNGSIRSVSINNGNIFFVVNGERISASKGDYIIKDAVGRIGRIFAGEFRQMFELAE